MMGSLFNVTRGQAAAALQKNQMHIEPHHAIADLARFAFCRY
jgi:hypothetical protein